MWTKILGMFGGNWMKLVPYAAGAIVMLGLSGYIWWINDDLEDAIEDKQYAENNVVLVTNEFDRLHNSHIQLGSDMIKQEKYYVNTMVAITEAHEKEIVRAVETAKMKERIKNVKTEDDGPIARVLGDTLDDLRVR